MIKILSLVFWVFQIIIGFGIVNAQNDCKENLNQFNLLVKSSSILIRTGECNKPEEIEEIRKSVIDGTRNYNLVLACIGRKVAFLSSDIGPKWSLPQEGSSLRKVPPISVLDLLYLRKPKQDNENKKENSSLQKDSLISIVLNSLHSLETKITFEEAIYRSNNADGYISKKIIEALCNNSNTRDIIKKIIHQLDSDQVDDLRDNKDNDDERIGDFKQRIQEVPH